ncbi:MAG: type VI secretion system baseplate subunit TssE [Desulfobacterales bacterium]|nr:type VI secretion system baseplate subunit TssE [Desulfobacterales bacterium]
MRENRLTERIRAWNSGPLRREGQDPKRMIDSVVGHLERLLNTRQGSAQIADDYGIPDFTDFKSAFPEAHRDLERSIRQTVQKYEPRLTSVRVKFIPQADEMLTVSFQIIARLILEGRKDAVVFESILDSDGKIRIRR